MSGGSYNYLCHKDSESILTNDDALEFMRDRLISLGYVDAAKETEYILLIMDQYRVEVDARLERLNKVFRSVEWMDSGDAGIEELEESIKQYRCISTK